MKKTDLALHHICRRARRLMRKKTIRRTLLFALPLFFFSLLGVFALVRAAVLALWPLWGLRVDGVFYLLCGGAAYLLSLLFLSPLWEGILAFAYRAAKQERADMTALGLFYMGARAYRFALLRGLGRMGRFLLWAFVSMGLGCVAVTVASKVGDVAGALLLALTFWLLLFLPFWFLHAGKDQFLSNAVKVDHEFALSHAQHMGEVKRLSHFAIGEAAREKVLLHRSAVWRLNLRFVPLFLLSVLLLGLPLLYVLPYFVLSRAVLRCRMLHE